MLDKEHALEHALLYAFYHKKYWSFKQAYTTWKRRNLLIKILTSLLLVVTGIIVGFVTLNPIPLGVLQV